MRFPWARQVKDETARAAREAAERRLARDREHVILPLRELRERNHVSDVITALIQRKVQGGRNDANPASD